jgi:hypothetical protein
MRRSKDSNNLSAAVRSGETLSTTARACRLSHVTFLLALLSLAAAMTAVLPEVSHAQKDTVISNFGGTTACGGECCYDFTFYVKQNGATCFTVVLTPTSSLDDPTCLDWTCLQTQVDSLLAWLGYPHNSVTLTNLSSGNVVKFKICWTGTGGQFPNPSTFHLFLCSTKQPPCLNWDNFYFVDDNNTNQSDSPLPEAWMCTTPKPCSGCNSISVEDNGCWVDVCFQDNGAVVPSFVLHFSPGLNGGNFSTSDPTFGQPCHDVPVLTAPTGWTYAYDPVSGNLTLTNSSGPLLSNCNGVCVAIPKSNLNMSRTVTLVSPNPCPGSITTPPMKAANGNQPGTWMVDNGTPETSTANNNYPNPVGAASGFKTTIPFTTSAKGLASIRVMNEKGEIVLKDNMEATYAGEHFFYITAENLPAGTYYYQIEFPKGKVIVSKTMLVVK